MVYWLQKCLEITWSEVAEECAGLGDQVGGWLFGAPIDPQAAATFDPRSYVSFVDRRGKEHARLDDINGFHMLECLVKRSLGLPLDPALLEHLAEFGDGTLCGWWKEHQLRDGRPYFRGRQRTRVVHDVDDTAWYIKFHERVARDEQLRPFLSSDTLPWPFHRLASAVSVDRSLVLRTWEHRVWHKWDCDLLCMANMISALPPDGTELQRQVFEANRALINAAIPEHHARLMMYYEPKVVGVFLLLYYDRAHRQYLTQASRDVLLRELEGGLDELASQEVRSRWAGDDRLTYLHGYNLQWKNGTLPALFARFARHLLETTPRSLALAS